MLSNSLYESQNNHTIPAMTALNHSREQIMCNLKYLATNTLEPFMTWLPQQGSYTFKIGSGFRNNTNTSDHNIGSAADLHIFNSSGQRVSRAQLLQIASKLVNANIPYTQLLLEFSGGSSPGWIHMANRSNGQNSALRVGYTFTGNAPYSSG